MLQFVTVYFLRCKTSSDCLRFVCFRFVLGKPRRKYTGCKTCSAWDHISSPRHKLVTWLNSCNITVFLLRIIEAPTRKLSSWYYPFFKNNSSRRKNYIECARLCPGLINACLHVEYNFTTVLIVFVSVNNSVYNFWRIPAVRVLFLNTAWECKQFRISLYIYI